MSTRATYQFETRMGRLVTFYIHQDGHPKGAAFYFNNALKAEQNGQELAARFFRANPKAEFTTGHDAHEDTEYRYQVILDCGLQYLTVVSCASWEEEKIVFCGTLQNFIDLNNEFIGAA